MYGYMGKVLRVNLSKKKATTEHLKDEVIRSLIGGRGFGAWFLWHELPANIDPLGPENKVIISVGPLAGTKALGVHRWMAQFKSPLTGTYFRSVGGGFFGAELKFAGYDAILIEGRSDEPIYLYIHDENIEFRNAEKVWGMTTDSTAAFLREETDKQARMIVIGPAGENLVKFAAIVTDDMRTASRGGGGAVMGVKNLKAIVVRGSKKPEIYNEKSLDETLKEEINAIKFSPGLSPLQELGTNSGVYLEYVGGCFPTYNYRQEKLYGALSFRPENLRKYIVKHYGCYGCMVRCGKIFKLSKGPYAGTVWDFPEYETHWAFGGNLGNINIESITYANMLADKYGLDTISAGSAIAFAIELYERGILGKSETDGLELRWGDPDIIPELIKKIALRIGIGRLLAEGVKRAAEMIGRDSERYAMHVKGLELPAHDPRRAKAFGLSMATSPIGASHTIGVSIFEEFGMPYKGRKVDPFDLKEKGEIAKYMQDITATYETGIWCIFIAFSFNITLDLYSKLLYAATGIKEFADPNYLLIVGERIFNLERSINARGGIDGKFDKMPERITKEPILRDDTPARGQIFEEDILVKDYYKTRGWNEKGIPTREKLRELGLEDLIMK
ncbi:MAG: aldehyde ferredoxin oxidoreductase family protein [Candidatus Bathyarchaeia archaeon]